MAKKPNIRFAGFEDDWEQRKLGELGEILTGSTPSTSNSAYYSEDGIPWVTPTDINELTISDTPRKLSEEGAKVGRVVPANTILCTCIASIGKNTLLTVKGSFNQQINSLTPYDENDAYFLLTDSEIWSNTMKRMAASGTMQIVNKTEFSELKTMVPSLVEQQAIGTYFHNLDHLITLHQRKCDELKKVKKFMLQKMFPKKGEKNPEIRFDGFTNDWEQRKLGDVVEFLDTMRKPLEGAKRISGPYPYYGASGIVDYVDGYLFDEELVLLSEDGANITDRNYPVCFLASGKYWVNNHAHVLKTKDGNENNFICNSLERKDYKQYNSGMAMPKLNQEVCRGIPISCPSFDEQKKIGDYFSNLDHLITLHQRKCEELKNVKKYMLQNMFAKGE